MDIIIRHVQESDHPELGDIYSFDSVVEQTSQLPHQGAEFWGHFYASKSPGLVELVAVPEQRVVGHMGILLNQHPRRKHVGSFGLAIHPHFQNKGVGTALLKELIRLSDDWLNLLKIELSVFSDNQVAIELYKKFDFVIEGESKYDLFKNGSYASSYRMARIHPNFDLT